MRSMLFLLVVALLAAGCSAPTTTIPTPTTPLETAAPLSTRTPLPSLTPRPSATLPPQPTAAATNTPLPTADPALAEITLEGIGWVEDYDMLVSLEFPGPVDPANYRVTVADKEYACELIAQYQNRLYCRGQGAKVMTVTTVRVYPSDSAEAGFEKEVWVPFFTNSYNWPND